MPVLWKRKRWPAACHLCHCSQQQPNSTTGAACFITGLPSQGQQRWAISGLAHWEAEKRLELRW